MTNETPEANLQNVEAAAKYLNAKFEEYLSQNPISILDVFMVVHNLHKYWVRESALRWAAEGIQPTGVFRLADMTFRKAMKELRLDALTPHPKSDSA